MNRTLLDECFRVKGRPTWYTSAEGIQRDLDQCLTFYNLKRSHQDYRLKGHTPAQALRVALGCKKLPDGRSDRGKGGAVASCMISGRRPRVSGEY